MFESIVEKVIVGGLDENGNVDPAQLTFVYKTGLKNSVDGAKFKPQRKNARGRHRTDELCSHDSNEVDKMCSDSSNDTRRNGCQIIPKKDTPKIEVTMEPDEESNYTPEEKATYQKIKDYVKNKYGVNVHTSYIAQVKRMCGLDMGENYNKSKKKNPGVKQCPQEKVEYIKDALRYFKLI